jgi:sporulation-control protein spo0M
MTYSEQELQAIFFEEHDDFQLIEELDSVDEGKYSTLESIFLQKSTGKHYSLSVSRSGSYFTDYDYNFFCQPVEVEQKEVRITQWVQVQNAETN